MKKILAFLTAVITVLSMVVSLGAAYDFKLKQEFVNDETFILGDVNGDGTVNAVDSYCIKTTLAGVCSEEIVLSAADFDADGKCSAPDSFNLKLCLSGAKATSDFESSGQLYRFTISNNDISEYSIRDFSFEYTQKREKTSNFNVFLGKVQTFMALQVLVKKKVLLLFLQNLLII